MNTKIIVEEHVIPQILTSAIEAFEVEHKTHSKGKAKLAIETYGLLWGYMIPSRHDNLNQIICAMATIETSALRHEDWVRPDLNSIAMKRDFIGKYWPQLELVGTFHSHPYTDVAEVNDKKGWRASKEDQGHWCRLHSEFAPELPSMAHLIVTIAALEKKGWAFPQNLAGNEASAGFILSSDRRKLWLRAYSSELEINEDLDDDGERVYAINSDVTLEMPSLIHRFIK